MDKLRPFLCRCSVHSTESAEQMHPVLRRSFWRRFLSVPRTLNHLLDLGTRADARSRFLFRHRAGQAPLSADLVLNDAYQWLLLKGVVARSRAATDGAARTRPGSTLLLWRFPKPNARSATVLADESHLKDSGAPANKLQCRRRVFERLRQGGRNRPPEPLLFGTGWWVPANNITVSAAETPGWDIVSCTAFYNR
jgi:hypothetical protein